MSLVFPISDDLAKTRDRSRRARRFLQVRTGVSDPVQRNGDATTGELTG